jgi:hypothetical protein
MRFPRKLAASAFKYCDWMKVLAASLAFAMSGKETLSPFSTWRFFSREQAKREYDWVVMSSVFVSSQSSCFFLCSREQICQVENRLN